MIVLDRTRLTGCLGIPACQPNWAYGILVVAPWPGSGIVRPLLELPVRIIPNEEI